MLKMTITLLTAALCIYACGTAEPSANSETAQLPVSDNNRTSLDWAGTYSGVVPCADCEGISTTIILSTEGMYRLVTRYLGKSDEPFTYQGTFTWDDAGGKITLNGIEDGPVQYLVGENQLIQLDLAGERIDGDLADRYVLRKAAAVTRAPTPGASLTETYWKLFEIRGVATPPLRDGQREQHLILSKQGQLVKGYGGCNAFRGSYEADEETLRLNFGDLASTLRACDEMDAEQQFVKMFEMVDNYAIKGDTLSLNRARMAPLARFVAVYH